MEKGTGKVTAPNPDSEAAVKDHYNRDHTRLWRPNPTLHRERGYGVDHHYGKAGENKYYVQPGHVQNPEHKNIGQRLESWGEAPTSRTGSAVPIKREKWEEYYELRKQMNKK